MRAHVLLLFLLTACDKVEPPIFRQVTKQSPPFPTRRLAAIANSASVTDTTSVTLAWDASTDPTVTGYRVYQGATSRAYTNTLDVGASTSATLSNLVYGATYFFAATTYNSAGLESDYSVEISWAAGAPLVTNVVTITSQVLRAGSPGGPWTGAGNPVVTVLTNPPGLAYFQTSMTIGQTNVAIQVLKLDRSTLVITNK